MTRGERNNGVTK